MKHWEAGPVPRRWDSFAGFGSAWDGVHYQEAFYLTSFDGECVQVSDQAD